MGPAIVVIVVRTFLSFIIIAFAAQISFADQEGSPSSFSIETADKKHIFVMLAPSGGEIPPFTRSGMYLNDGSAALLWPVDWTGFAYVPNGGEYLIRPGRWPRYTGTYRDEALSFIKAGEVIKTYRTLDLIDFPWLLPHSASHYRWTDLCFTDAGEGDVVMQLGGGRYSANESVAFFGDSTMMQADAVSGDKFLFDTRTGEIISEYHPSRYYALTFLGLLLLPYLILRYMSAGRLSAKSITLSNLAAGFVLSACVLIIPSAAVGFSQVLGNCDEHLPTFFERLWMSFYLLPIYFTATLFNATPAQAESFQIGQSLSWSLPFWFACFLVLCLVDRVVIDVFRKLRGDGGSIV